MDLNELPQEDDVYESWEGHRGSGGALAYASGSTGHEEDGAPGKPVAHFDMNAGPEGSEDALDTEDLANDIEGAAEDPGGEGAGSGGFLEEEEQYVEDAEEDEGRDAEEGGDEALQHETGEEGAGEEDEVENAGGGTVPDLFPQVHRYAKDEIEEAGYRESDASSGGEAEGTGQSLRNGQSEDQDAGKDLHRAKGRKGHGVWCLAATQAVLAAPEKPLRRALGAVCVPVPVQLKGRWTRNSTMREQPVTTDSAEKRR